jgi:hypothetical protein
MIPDERILEYLRTKSGKPEDDTPEAEVALATADRVLTWIEVTTDRHFREPKEFVLRLNGEGIGGLWLPELPIDDGESIPELLLEIELLENGTWSIVPEDDYELVTTGVTGPYLVEHKDEWPMGRRNIRVTFTAGYEFGELPGDIEQLVLEMVAHRYRERGNEGLRSETIGGYSYSRADMGGTEEFREDWKTTLARWRHGVFA